MFWTVVLEKTLESPLDCKEIQQSILKEISPGCSLVGLMFEAEIPILWPPDAKIWLIWKDLDVGKDWGQKEKGTTEDEMVGWHHWLNGHGFRWTPGVGDGQGGPACCSSWGRKESDMTERLNWTDWFLEDTLLYIFSLVLKCADLLQRKSHVLSCPHHVCCQNQWLKLQPLQKRVWQFLKQLNMELPYDPAIPLLGTYPKEMKTSTQTNTYLKMFLTAKDENSPNVCQWMNRVYPCNRTLFGHKNNEVLIRITMWMNLHSAKWKKPVKKSCCMTLFGWNIWKNINQSTEIKSKPVDTWVGSA